MGEEVEEKDTCDFDDAGKCDTDTIYLGNYDFYIYAPKPDPSKIDYELYRSAISNLNPTDRFARPICSLKILDGDFDNIRCINGLQIGHNYFQYSFDFCDFCKSRLIAYYCYQCMKSFCETCGCKCSSDKKDIVDTYNFTMKQCDVCSAVIPMMKPRYSIKSRNWDCCIECKQHVEPEMQSLITYESADIRIGSLRDWFVLIEDECNYILINLNIDSPYHGRLCFGESQNEVNFGFFLINDTDIKQVIEEYLEGLEEYLEGLEESEGSGCGSKIISMMRKRGLSIYFS